MRAILVFEAPQRLRRAGTQTRAPSRAALPTEFLCSLLGMHWDNFEKAFETVTILAQHPDDLASYAGGSYPTGLATDKATKMRRQWKGRHVVALGKNVVRALGVNFAGWFDLLIVPCDRDRPDRKRVFTTLIFPGPHTTNRLWKARGFKKKGEASLSRFLESSRNGTP